MPCYSSMIFGIYMDYIWGFIIVRDLVLITVISMSYGFPRGSPGFIIRPTACVCVCPETPSGGVGKARSCR